VVVGLAVFELLVGAGEHGRGLLVPVEVLGVVAPEGLWVVEGVLLDFVLGVGHLGRVSACELEL
jgi:hypothetical protein